MGDQVGAHRSLDRRGRDRTRARRANPGAACGDPRRRRRRPRRRARPRRKSRRQPMSSKKTGSSPGRGELRRQTRVGDGHPAGPADFVASVERRGREHRRHGTPRSDDGNEHGRGTIGPSRAGLHELAVEEIEASLLGGQAQDLRRRRPRTRSSTRGRSAAGPGITSSSGGPDGRRRDRAQLLEEPRDAPLEPQPHHAALRKAVRQLPLREGSGEAPLDEEHESGPRAARRRRAGAT